MVSDVTCTGEKTYIDEVVEVLEAGLDEHFETVADDGSAKEVRMHPSDHHYNSQ